jgi:DNA-binding CsgD family transcriptional regulator
MIKVLAYIIFILSVGLTAGGVALSSRLRSRYRHDIFSTLLYFQVFIFTFGFYGIWGQALIKTFLSVYISVELINRFSEMTQLLGLPFLVFAWLMLIRFSSGISGRGSSNWFIFWFLLLNFSVIVLIGYVEASGTGFKASSLTKNYFIILNSVYSVVAAILIFFPGRGRSIIHNYDIKIIAPAILTIMIMQNVTLSLYDSQEYLALIFILTFFAGNAFLPVYLSYGTLLSAFTDTEKTELTFEEFCRKFEVSPRETDIIREICNGLSNKEISEKLFISLQTVKDHSHRIYIKTNVKSRVQLINLVKELKNL